MLDRFLKVLRIQFKQYELKLACLNESPKLRVWRRRCTTTSTLGRIPWCTTLASSDRRGSYNRPLKSSRNPPVRVLQILQILHSDVGSSLFFHPSIALHFSYFNLIVCVKCVGKLIARLHRLRQLIVTPQTCFVHMAADSKRLVELHGENTPTGMVPGTFFSISLITEALRGCSNKGCLVWKSQQNLC